MWELVFSAENADFILHDSQNKSINPVSAHDNLPVNRFRATYSKSQLSCATSHADV
jgi:hypothetical protein